MGRWHLTGSKLFLTAIAGIFAACPGQQPARAGSYLAKTDPPPIRLAPARAETVAGLLPPLAMSDLPTVPTNTATIATNILATTTPPQETASTNSVTNQISSASNTNTALLGPAGPVNLDPFDAASANSNPPAPVTPQMLVEYLMPAPGSTNGPQASVTVPALIDFMPPMPHPRSQAIYESK